jgi:hypothetical protein
MAVGDGDIAAERAHLQLLSLSGTTFERYQWVMLPCVRIHDCNR